MRRTSVWLAAGLFAAPAMGGLITTHQDTDASGATVDGSLGVDEYGTGNAYVYTGGGSGFGGPLGSGSLYLQADATNLYVGAQINGDLGSNIMAVFLDTRAGGFTSDATLGDTADGGRRVASQLTRDVQDNLPIGADFVLEFGNGYTNVFELVTGSLNYIAPSAAGTGGNGAAGFREASVALSTLGLSAGQSVDLFAVLISDTGFASNEGIPSTGIANNPGFDNAANGGGAVTWPNNHRFTLIPEPASLGLAAAGGLMLVARRRRGVK